jgi:hypothetical protein
LQERHGWVNIYRHDMINEYSNTGPGQVAARLYHSHDSLELLTAYELMNSTATAATILAARDAARRAVLRGMASLPPPQQVGARRCEPRLARIRVSRFAHESPPHGAPPDPTPPSPRITRTGHWGLGADFDRTVAAAEDAESVAESAAKADGEAPGAIRHGGTHRCMRAVDA